MTSYAAFAAACPVPALAGASHTAPDSWVLRLLTTTANAWSVAARNAHAQKA